MKDKLPELYSNKNINNLNTNNMAYFKSTNYVEKNNVINDNFVVNEVDETYSESIIVDSNGLNKNRSINNSNVQADNTLSFRDMTIPDKIDYLSKLPDVIEPQCLVLLEESDVEGMFLNYKNDQVSLDVNGLIINIPVEDIRDIIIVF